MADDNVPTLAVIYTELKHLTRLLEAHIKEDEKHTDDRERRLRILENERIPAMEGRIGRIEERQSTASRMQIAFTTIAAALAAWLGITQ